uniref:ATP-dependent RNA helicase Ski2/MTR4 C-terminal domain-containing protein n=1 Tax=Pyramimonas obovata TaxID=1411642 RepID=A0A6T7WV57_9CHLO
MGVNAPARTVVFHSIRKHDGRSFRTLLSGEYTQMAGRAGRRGLDTVGTVIIMAPDDKVPEEAELRTLITGKATMLESQFRLRYNMIVNLLRVEDLSVEDMLKRSFAELHAQRAMKGHGELLHAGERLLRRITALAAAHAGRPCGCPCGCVFGRPEVEEYYELVVAVQHLTTQVHAAVMQSPGAKQALSPGRVVLLRSLHGVPEPAVVLRMGSAPTPPVGGGRTLLRAPSGDDQGTKQLYVLALHRGAGPEAKMKVPTETATAQQERMKASTMSMGMEMKRKDDLDMGLGKLGRVGSRGVWGTASEPPPAVPLPHYASVGEVGYALLLVPSEDILSITKSKLKVDAGEVLERLDLAAVARTVAGLQRQLDEPLEALSNQELKFNDVDAVEAYQVRQQYLSEMAKFQCHQCPKLPEQYALIAKRRQLAERVRELQYRMSDQALQQMPDYHMRVRVLQEMGYIDDEKVVQMKGRVMCELNSCDELLGSEMIFAGHLTDLCPEEAIALLSALIFQEKTDNEPVLPTKLMEACDKVRHLARACGERQLQCGLEISPEDYCREVLKFGLTEVVYEWAKGTPFADICMLTDVPEGSIVRTIVRLDEMCREVKDAARLMGDSTLFLKMQTASELIKRDIVFSASLYVSKA